MARKPRLEWEGASYHVMARGNERARIFKSSRDHALFVETLGQSLERFGVVLHAWCLMPNHFHLAASTPRGNLSRWMAWLQTTFTTRYNRRHKRVGHLFQGRYRAEVVDTDAYATRLVLYIHLNPVRRKKDGRLEFIGGLEELSHFPWSGHVDLLGLRSKALLPLDSGWHHYWGCRASKVIQGYRKAIQRALGLQPQSWSDVVERGLVAGNPDFVEKILQRLRDQKNTDAKAWRRPLEWEKARQRLAKQLEQENNQAVVAWVRTRLLGERGVDVGRSLGHRDGSGVTQAAKRLEALSKIKADLKEILEKYRSLSNVKN